MTVIIKQVESEEQAWDMLTKVSLHFGESFNHTFDVENFIHQSLTKSSIDPEFYAKVEEFQIKYPLDILHSKTINGLGFCIRAKWRGVIVTTYDYHHDAIICDSHGFVLKQFLVVDIPDEIEAVQVKLSIF